MTQPVATIAVPGGKVWSKRVGGGSGLPLLVVHGGPGLPHYYLTTCQRCNDWPANGKSSSGINLAAETPNARPTWICGQWGARWPR
ncbi:prolyl aminopeptidase domain protein [Mycobacterium ulcerans str. Harvey]|uniref:Prolyl aminopeptidase domain protein n=1 Tax=Mycobacterium ulcerans str. Harvey TaxID=1299332 RepID=A0ABN0R799_MYCUL|nr:prolyl aminopeptidase domain protein [Mycobacterium ulcerans str. Harvey]